MKQLSVVMTNYNTQPDYLKSAVESVLNQTFSDFEFIVVDDGSTDGSPNIIEEYAKSDSRIIFFKNESNMGITKSLNRGFSAAGGEYIARMDADDISLSTRFEKQIDFMNRHPDVIVCGTWADLIGDGAEKRKKKTWTVELPEREEFRCSLLFGNQASIIHPTAMFRKSMLDRFDIKYDENYPVSQDYKMWVECSKYAQCSNVPEILFQYRLNNKSVSATASSKQYLMTKKNIKEQLSRLHIDISDDDYNIHYGFLTGRKAYDKNTYRWLRKLIDSNDRYEYFNKKVFGDIIWSKWAEIIYYDFALNRSPRKLADHLFELPNKYKVRLLKKIIYKGLKKNAV